MRMQWIRMAGRDGAALMTVVLIILAVGGMLAVTVNASLQRVHSTRKLADRVRALAIAEAGANQAYSVLQTNFAARLDPDAFPITAYGGGTYDVTITPVSNNVAVISSLGRFATSSEQVILDVKNFAGPTPGGPPPGSAWEKTIFSNGRTYVNGNGDIDGAMHGNNFVRFNGGLDISPGPVHITSSTEIRVNGHIKSPGDLTAPIIDVSGDNQSGATLSQQSVAWIDFPVLDLTPYYNTALANNRVLTGRTYDNDIDWSSEPGGVVWIQGDARFKGDVIFGGTMVVTGTVRIDGNANWDVGGGQAGTIISRDSTITISGNAQCDALLYAPGNITLNGNVVLNGQIISGNDVSINGNVDVINYVYTNPNAGTDGSSEDLIYATAWQK